MPSLTTQPFFSLEVKTALLWHILARKAFWPAKIPFPFVHIDTGHNFPETMAFRNQLIKDLGVQLVVGSVQESIDEGAVAGRDGNQRI